MKVKEYQYTQEKGWNQELDIAGSTLILVFASRSILEDDILLEQIRIVAKHQNIVGCSTAGEIYGTEVYDGSLTLTALYFEQVSCSISYISTEDSVDTAAAGSSLADSLSKNEPVGDLRHVIVFSDGLAINGSHLVSSLTSRLPEGVTLTGGLAGDGSDFQKTAVVYQGHCYQRGIVAVGFYGEALRVSFASLGGWDSFGPDRVVTRSIDNQLFELNGQPALELYKKYLGEHASELPSSGLLFPLSIAVSDQSERLVRTILAVDENAGSITFAGDIPEGASVRLMMANFDRLIEGACGAATEAIRSLENLKVDYAMLISCVGRKIVLGQRICEEVEAVRDILGSTSVLSGFYSYGEISPFTPGVKCELHNQTMTITTFTEG